MRAFLLLTRVQVRGDNALEDVFLELVEQEA